MNYDSYDTTSVNQALISFIEIKKKVTRQLDADIIDLIIYVLSWFMQEMVGSSSRDRNGRFIVM
jgi:hypothetical protein